MPSSARSRSGARPDRIQPSGGHGTGGLPRPPSPGRVQRRVGCGAVARPQRRSIDPPLDGIGGPASAGAVRRWVRTPDPTRRSVAPGSTVGTDVDRFVRAASTSDPSRWIDALSLVRGRLFDGLSLSDWAVLDGTSRPSWSRWWSATALQGAEEALRLGSGEEAEWMIRRGLRVSPYDERLYRGLLRATEAKGNRLGLRSAMAELLQPGLRWRWGTVCTPQTLALYRELAHRRGARGRRGPRQAVGFRPAMARSSTGKSVARAAATGGGTTYRGQMPVNWYAALVIIVILGIGLGRLRPVQLRQGRHPSPRSTDLARWTGHRSSAGRPSRCSPSPPPAPPMGWRPRPAASRDRAQDEQPSRGQRHAGQVRLGVPRHDADQQLR